MRNNNNDNLAPQGRMPMEDVVQQAIDNKLLTPQRVKREKRKAVNSPEEEEEDIINRAAKANFMVNAVQQLADIGSFKIYELKALAKNIGLEGCSNHNKQKIYDLIRNHYENRVVQAAASPDFNWDDDEKESIGQGPASPAEGQQEGRGFTYHPIRKSEHFNAAPFLKLGNSVINQKALNHNSFEPRRPVGRHLIMGKSKLSENMRKVIEAFVDKKQPSKQLLDKLDLDEIRFVLHITKRLRITFMIPKNWNSDMTKAPKVSTLKERNNPHSQLLVLQGEMQHRNDSPLIEQEIDLVQARINQLKNSKVRRR